MPKNSHIPGAVTPGGGTGTPAEIPPTALLELVRIIVPDVKRGLQALGYPTHRQGTEFLLNIACLCNEVAVHRGHLHVHFIPRTRSPFRILTEILAEDRQWGKNYVPLERAERICHPRQQETLRLTMAQAMDGSA